MMMYISADNISAILHALFLHFYILWRSQRRLNQCTLVPSSQVNIDFLWTFDRYHHMSF